MDPMQNNHSLNTSASAIDLYARAAATLYGIISFDNFCKILDIYYGESSLSKEGIMAYFWSSRNDDPIYYTQDELIVHTSIFPDEVARTFSEIWNSSFAPATRCYRVLPQKEFLRYADPFFYEDCRGTRQMEKYLISDLSIPRKDVEEIVAEMVFICRSAPAPPISWTPLPGGASRMAGSAISTSSTSAVKWSRGFGVGRLLDILVMK